MDFAPSGPTARVLNALGWIAAVLLLFVVARPRGGFEADYLLLWAGAHASERGPLVDLYDVAEGERLTKAYFAYADHLRPDFASGVRHIPHEHFFSSPLLVAVTKSMSGGDMVADTRRWRETSVVLFAGGLLLFAAAVGIPGPAAAALLAAFTLRSPGFAFGVALGNSTVMVVGALLVILSGLRFRNDAATALVGGALGFLAAMKGTVLFVPALLGVLFLVQRRWRTAICFSLAVVLAATAGIVWSQIELGPGYSWVSWSRSLPTRLLTPFWRGGSFLGKLFGPLPLPLYSIWGAFLLMLASAWIFAVARTPALRPSLVFAQEAAVAALGAVLALVSQPLVHSFYFLQAAPAAIVAIGATRPPWRRVILGAGLAAAALFFFNNNALFARWGLTHGFRHSAITFVGVWILIGAAAWRLRVLQAPPS